LDQDVGLFNGSGNKVFKESGTRFSRNVERFSMDLERFSNGSGKAIQGIWKRFFVDLVLSGFWNVPVFRGSGFVSLRELLQMS
jgi:hypothetical protein